MAQNLQERVTRVQDHVKQHVCLQEHVELSQNVSTTLLGYLKRLPARTIQYTTVVQQGKDASAGRTYSTGDQSTTGSSIFHLLAGYLTSSHKPGSEGVLILQDITGEICCRLINKPPLEDINCYILLLSWNFIRIDSTRFPPAGMIQNYLEISDYHCLFQVPPPVSDSACTDSIVYLSVAQVLAHVRTKQKYKPKLLNVCAYVDAVSDLLRNGPSRMMFIRLRDTNTLDTYNMICNIPKLLYLSHCLEQGKAYRFSSLRDVVMNRGDSRILAMTATTQVEEATQLTVEHMECLTAPLSGSVRMVDLESLSQSFEDTDLFIPTPDGAMETVSLVSYVGVITACLLPEAGIFELDHTVRLYLTYMDTCGYGLGLRLGATVQLCNVHILKPPCSSWKKLGGFYCCPAESQITIVKFSNQPSTIKPFYTKGNQLVPLIRKLSPVDMAWIIHVFLIFERSGLLNIGETLNVIEMLHQSLQQLKWNATDCFRTHLSRCPISLNLMELRPHLLSVAELHVAVNEKASSVLPTAYSEASVHGQSVPQWNYTMLTSTTLLPSKIMIVGILTGNSHSGCLQLKDSSGTIMVIRTDEQDGRNELLSQMGNILVVDEFSVIVEQTLLPHAADSTHLLLSYLVVLKWRSVPCGPSRELLNTSSTKPSDDSRKGTLFFVVVGRNSLVKALVSRPSTHWFAEVEVMTHSDKEELAKAVASNQHTGPRHSSAVCKRRVLRFTGNAVSMYSLVQYGFLYSLTFPQNVKVSTACFITLTHRHTIKVIECSSQWQVRFPLLDVTDIITMAPLPSFSIVDGHSSLAPTKDNAHSNELVSFTGVVISHGFKIDQFSIDSSLSSSSSSLSNMLSTSLSSPSLSPYVVSIQVRSTAYPDTIAVYCNLKQFPLNIGLIPGVEAAFYKFEFKQTHSGNPFTHQCPSSSIRILSFPSSVINQEERGHCVSSEMLGLSITPLDSLMNKLLSGELSRRVVAVRAEVISVQQVSLILVCQVCGVNVVGGACATHCVQKRHVLKQEARLLIDDGTSEAHVYLEAGLVAPGLCCPLGEWNDLVRQAEGLGRVIYSRFTQTGSTRTGKGLYSHFPSDCAKAHTILAEIANNPRILRKVMVYSSPFVSSSELKETVIGRKTFTTKIASASYNTLALPRIQLKAVGIQDINSLYEIRKITSNSSVIL